MLHGCTHSLLPLVLEHMCTVTGSKCTLHRNTKIQFARHTGHKPITVTDDKQHPPLGGGGVIADSTTTASIRHWGYPFFPLNPFFSKNFCIPFSVGNLMAAELELVERVPDPCVLLTRCNRRHWAPYSLDLWLHICTCRCGLWNRSRLGGTG